MGQSKTCASSKICMKTKDVKQTGKTLCWTVLDSTYKQERCLVKLANKTIPLFWEGEDKIPIMNKKDRMKDDMTAAIIRPSLLQKST